MKKIKLKTISKIKNKAKKGIALGATLLTLTSTNPVFAKNTNTEKKNLVNVVCSGMYDRGCAKDVEKARKKIELWPEGLHNFESELLGYDLIKSKNSFLYRGSNSLPLYKLINNGFVPSIQKKILNDLKSSIPRNEKILNEASKNIETILNDELVKYNSLKEVSIEDLESVNEGEYVVVQGKPVDLDVNKIINLEGTFEGKGITVGNFFSSSRFGGSFVGLTNLIGNIKLEGKMYEDIEDGFLGVLTDEENNYFLVKKQNTEFMNKIREKYNEIFERINKVKNLENEINEKYGEYSLSGEDSAIVIMENRRILFEEPPWYSLEPGPGHDQRGIVRMTIIRDAYKKIAKQIGKEIDPNKIKFYESVLKKIDDNINDDNLKKLQINYKIDKDKSYENRREYRIIGKKITVDGFPTVEVLDYGIVKDNGEIIMNKVSDPSPSIESLRDSKEKN